MQFMLNTLHLQNGGSSDSDDCTCVVHQTFHGKLSSTVTCDSCRNTTTALDPFMDLSLDVRNLPKKRKLEAGSAGEVQMDLRDCLDRFTGREKLGSAEYTCRNCDGGQNAVKQLSIKRLPPTLSIHLKVSSSPSDLCIQSILTRCSVSNTQSPPLPKLRPKYPSPSPSTSTPTPPNTAPRKVKAQKHHQRQHPQITTSTRLSTPSSTSSPPSSSTKARSIQDTTSAIRAKAATGSPLTTARSSWLARRKYSPLRPISCST